MILFYGEGRLGNQLFQYQALNKIARCRETIAAIGLEDIAAVFDPTAARVRVLFRNGWLKRAAKYIFLPVLLRPLCRYFRIFNYARETSFDDRQHAGLSGEYQLRRGLFSRVTFVDGGYYQNAQLSENIFPISSLRLKPALRASAQQFIAANIPHESVPIFVHVRRGDYLHFSSYGINNLALPERFFRDAIKLAEQKISSAHFIFVTDDATWVNHAFADVTNKTVASFNPHFDFAIMTQCRGAILSNSTFSLAAALLLESPEIVIGPKYWFGFRVNRWLPPRIQFSNPRFNYLAVVTEAVAP